MSTKALVMLSNEKNLSTRVHIFHVYMKNYKEEAFHFISL